MTPPGSGGLKPNVVNFLMKVFLLHGAHLAMGYSFLECGYSFIQVDFVYDG